MSFSFVPTTREVLEQIVREPRFRAQTQIPVFAPMEIGLLIGCYALFALSSYLFIAEMLPMPLMLATNGFAIYAVFTPLHDATHRTCSGNRTVNDLLGTLACLLLIPGITTRIYRYLHLEHHRYAGDPKRDPDEIFVAAKPIALPFVLTCIDLVWTFWYLRRWQSRPRNERIECTFCIAFYAGFHVVGLLSPWALEFFLLWMIPQRIGLFMVGWFLPTSNIRVTCNGKMRHFRPPCG